MSAGPTGVRPFARWSAARNASIGLTEDEPAGVWGRATGFRAQGLGSAPFAAGSASIRQATALAISCGFRSTIHTPGASVDAVLIDS